MIPLKQIFKKVPDINEVIKDGKEVIGMTSNKEQGSKRHKIDMFSDNKLSKNIRPIIIIWSFSLFTIMMGSIIIFKIEFPATVMTTMLITLGACVTFYFPGRSAEKYFRTLSKDK